MKILLVAVALLIAIEGWAEAHPPGWATYPGPQNTRGNNPGGLPWTYPQPMQNQNNGFGPDVEWVCQNPRTNDIMIIASDNTQHTPQQYPGKGPWWQWHNVPPGHQKEHHPHGNHWTQPIIIIQETPNTDKNRTPLPFPTTFPTTEIPNNNDQQTQSPPYHGGEGSIDIRIGDNDRTK